ncbi:DUF4177 domain-containing protein [Epibacterium sp. SM1979]|uniref:DUF4177 domain-containing protein n=1 Tax=Tritonibacter litoralis TaxID=2662264 RepID=A0A843YET2_9RHOB|nr:DUF4177 domain-containing protein [Tritonibacter litoralis]MQQ07609.1 DUF4177 domain-containing protein [Tritonibacter litoralis]
MPAFEYKVVPAPAKGTKAKGVKTPEARFANSVEITLNEMAAEGWEYLRAELLPSEERSGLTSSTTNWRNVLIFRRALAEEDAQVEEPQVQAPMVEPVSEGMEPPVDPEPERLPERPALRAEPLLTVEEDEIAFAGDPSAEPSVSPVPGPGAVRMLKDDGVEEVSPVAGLTAALRNRANQKSDDS